MQTRTEDLTIGERTAVLTRPVDGGPFPGVVMLHEAWGIDDVLRRQAARLAARGYVVVAPDLLGRGFWPRCVSAAMKAMQSRQGPPFAMITAAQEWLLEDPGCTGRLGVIGFCMGGGFALLTAQRGFEASAVNYGDVPDDVDQVVAGACPVVASYGERDKHFAPMAGVLSDALERAGVEHDVKVYPGASHSFLNDAVNGPLLFRPLMRIAGVGPHPASAADAWQRIESFFARHLQEPERPA